jgi:hypothetical protein
MLSWKGHDLRGDAHVGTAALGGSAEQITQGEINSTHGKYKKTKQGRTQKVKTYCPQESENRKAAEAAGICPWLEEAQGEEDGARRGEAVKDSTWHLALGPRG